MTFNQDLTTLMTNHEVDGRNPVPVKQVVGTWKEIGVAWLTNQGVSTVLLVLILGAIAHGIPNYVLPAIQSGYEQNAAIQRDTLKIYTEARDRELKAFIDGHDRDRAAFEKAIDRIK